MNDKIFGYSWDEIQAMQQRAYKTPTINTTKQGKAKPTENDHKLLNEHGIDGLKNLGFYGVLDRLNLL